MSKKPKGLSVEEKRTRLLELFHQKKDVFTLKELEKIAPKEKAIVMQSVKDVLQSLVSDDLVETDKIGSSTYFWSFPSKAINTKIRKLEEIKTKISELQSKTKHLTSELKKYESNEEEVELKEQLEQQIASLENRRQELKTNLELYKDSDPEVLEQMRQDCAISKEAINRWTDNVDSVKKWCRNKFAVEESVLNKQFGIPEELDYIS